MPSASLDLKLQDIQIIMVALSSVYVQLGNTVEYWEAIKSSGKYTNGILAPKYDKVGKLMPAHNNALYGVILASFIVGV